MSGRPVLIAGRWRPARPAGETFRAVDPVSGEILAPEFPVSAWEDVEEALTAGSRAASLLADFSGAKIADALDLAACRLLERADELVAAAARETALPVEPRLRSSELPRTVGQLRDYLYISDSSTSELVAHMEQAGYVEQEFQTGAKLNVLIKAAKGIKTREVMRIAKAATRNESVQQLYVAVTEVK